MYQYANQLQEAGHRISIFHSIKRPYKKSSTPLWMHRLKYKMGNISKVNWFTLHKDIRLSIVPEISDRYIPDADIVLSTWWEMAYMISRLSSSRGKKINLVQDYEVWEGNAPLVEASYKLPIRHVAISKYLAQMVYEKSGNRPVYFPNSIDTQKFFINTPIADRNPLSILMLYSEEPRKGTQYGIAALENLKHDFPQLICTLFGVYKNRGNYRRGQFTFIAPRH